MNQPEHKRPKVPDRADFNGTPQGDDERAHEEAQRFANGRDLQRSETFKNLLNKIAMSLVVVVSLGIGTSIAFLFFHLLAPVDYHFLNAEQIGRVQAVVLSGTAVGIAQNYLKKHT